MNVETRILKLEELFGVISHTKTYELMVTLKESEQGLLNIQQVTKMKIHYDILDGLDISEGTEILETIELQMQYLKENIRVVENALMCHNAKCSEKRTLFGKLQTIWLN